MGLSQEELAEQANVPQPYVSDLERQKTLPFAEDRVAIARVLGIKESLLSEVVPAEKTDKKKDEGEVDEQTSRHTS